MENGKDVCEECGGEICVGDWPFCGGDKAKHVPMENFGLPPLDYIDIQLLPRNDPRVDSVDRLGIPGVHITSRAQRQQIMKEQGLQFGTQKFDRRGIIYGGSATSERFKGVGNHPRKQKKRR